MRQAVEQRAEGGAGFDWHLRRAAELDEIMRRGAIGDTVLATDGLPVTEVARQVLARAGWLPGQAEPPEGHGCLQPGTTMPRVNASRSAAKRAGSSQ